MITFTRYTRLEPVQVVCPYDPAVDETDEVLSAMRRGDELRAPTQYPYATVFELRALGPLELRTIDRIKPTAPPGVARRTADRLAAARYDHPPPAPTASETAEDAWYTGELLTAYARAGLVAIRANAPDGWDNAATEPLGTMRVWSEHAIGGLPADVVVWIGMVVARLTHPMDTEKKSGSG